MTAPAKPSGVALWAIVELFGHQKISGKVTEEVIAGAAMLRVDVPAAGEATAFTRYYGSGAIYAITPVTEEVARLAADWLRAEPITVYIPELRQRPASTGPAIDADLDDDDDGDDARDFG